jgi:pseudaminic acid cytidylyltransferase
LRKYSFYAIEKNADDFATTADVLIEVIEGYGKLGIEFEYLSCIYPTAPFATAQKLKDSFNLLLNKEADSVIPVVKFSYPIQRAFRINRNDKLEYLWPENISKRSQDLEDVFHDAGQFYWYKAETIINKKSFVSGNNIGFLVSELEVQDIDNEEDWKIAELKYKQL